jgi:cytoskeletal protein CcmA (bactofilin family)
MSCPSAMTCLLYAEGELAGSALRETEAHLVGCRDCRARVMALREEGTLLGEVLRGELRHLAPAAIADSRGIALGIPFAVAAVTIAFAAAGALIDMRLPGAFDLLHPRRLKGAVEMTFDVIFMLRERAPGLVELGFAAAAVASASALLTFAVGAFSRRILGTAPLLLVALIAAAEPARAFEIHREPVFHIARGERVDQNVVATGDRVEIEGTLDGDLIAAAERVSVRGEVTGSIYVFCRDLDITGSVGGAVHAIAETSRIDGTIRQPVYIASEDFALTANGRLLSDAHLFVDAGVIEGEVRRDVMAAAERLDLRGQVGRDVESPWIEEIYLRDGSHVGGDVHVRLEEGRSIERSPGARVDGEVKSSPRESRREHYLEHYRDWRFYAGHLAWFAAAFVFGLIVYWIAPVIFRGAIADGSQLLRTLVTGFVVLIVLPIAMIAAALTIVGIPTAIAALFAYILALYTADLVVGAWLGRLLVPPADDSLFEFGKSLAVGFAVLSAVSLVPFLGPAAGVVALLLGLGLLTERARTALG